MATISNIAQRILDENHFTTSDITLTNLEYLIDNAIDYVNMQAGTTIADLAGDAEIKSLTATEPQIIAIKFLSSLMIRAYKEKGPQTNLSPLSVTQIITDPHFSLFKQWIDKAIDRLKSPPIYLSNDPIPT